MPLTKSKGQMYPWVTHTHSHLGGECPHKCVYCYVDNPRFGRPDKYKGPLRLIEKEFDVKYGTGKTIFIENCNDLFADAVPIEFIRRIFRHCYPYNLNTYVFQTKNPSRYHELDVCFPGFPILGTTIETNRIIPGISEAPPPSVRMIAMSMLHARKFVTMEPILDFDLDVIIEWMKFIKPEFVNIGADSKGHGLPEPDGSKVAALINELNNLGIEIRQKRNLDRLMGGPQWNSLHTDS